MGEFAKVLVNPSKFARDNTHGEFEKNRSQKRKRGVRKEEAHKQQLAAAGQREAAEKERQREIGIVEENQGVLGEAKKGRRKLV